MGVVVGTASGRVTLLQGRMSLEGSTETPGRSGSSDVRRNGEEVFTGASHGAAEIEE